MGVLANLVRREARALTESEWLLRALGGPVTYTGRQVGVSDALRLTTVYACVEVISDTIASLPCLIYKRLEDGGKERTDGHRLFTLLHDSPNPEMTAFEFWQAVVGHLELWGNAYAEIERDQAGRVAGLWPLRPDRMRVERDKSTRAVTYTYLLEDREIGLAPESVFHLRGLSADGLIGYSRIGLTREAVGLGLAMEEYEARFFGNDGTPGGILTTTGKLSPEAQTRLKESWNQAHRGLTKAHRVAVLEEGVAWQSIGIPQRDSQFLETRKFQAEEIARIFRVPPHKVGILDRATFSNIEELQLEFVGDTIRPRLERIEQRVLLSLMSDDHRRTYFPEFLVDALLRGNLQSRYQAYAIGRNNGWLSANDVRRFENLNPLPGDAGDIYLQPVNMVEAGEPPPQPAPKIPAPTPTAGDPSGDGDA